MTVAVPHDAVDVVEPTAREPFTVSDFGGVKEGVALGKAEPRSEHELVELVQFCRTNRRALTPRGFGLSQSGQSIPDESVLVELGRLNDVADVDLAHSTITVGPGATFRQVLQKSLARGLAPPVCPLNLDLSVGGVLSAGGLGSTSHQYGFAVSHVRSVRCVLGTGEVVVASPGRNRDVFDAILGGVGRVGFIVEAKVFLSRVSQTLTTWTLRYDCVQDLLQDQVALSEDPRVTHLDGLTSGATLGLAKGPNGQRSPLRHWSSAIQFSVEESDAEIESLVAGLRALSVVHREEDDVASFMARYDVRFQAMKATGAWAQPHPWFEVVLPLECTEAFIESARCLPPFFGDVLRVSVIRASERPRSIALPDGPGPWATVAVLPVGIAKPMLPMALQALEALDLNARELGGKRYLSGCLFATDEAGWRRHYGEDYEHLKAVQTRLDPDAILRSRLPRL